MTTFGELLRKFRNTCNDPNDPARRLSQERLGQLLGYEMGDHGFSGAAVSDWEKGKSKIHADNRPVLIGLLKVLYKNGGLKVLSDAELLFEAGNYRALGENEKREVFPKDLLQKSTQSIAALSPADDAPSRSGFQKLLNDAKDGPPPVWPRVAAALMRGLGDQMETWNLVRALFWLPVWILAHNMLDPVLQWPFPSHEVAFNSTIIYICASFILPLCIGLLTNTDNNLVWKGREETLSTILRLYTYQGAFIGFHVGYFAILAFRLLAFYFQIGLHPWFQFGLAGCPVLMGAIGAHVVPDNLWRAYGELSLHEGAVFFVFIPLGLAWGWFFLRYYLWLISPVVGTAITITALILAAWLTRRKSDVDSTR